jgi:hypothetical protein
VVTAASNNANAREAATLFSFDHMTEKRQSRVRKVEKRRRLMRFSRWAEAQLQADSMAHNSSC